MLNDFLPGIIAVAVIAAAFLCAWIPDLRRRRLTAPRPAPTQPATVPAPLVLSPLSASPSPQTSRQPGSSRPSVTDPEDALAQWD